MKLMIDGTWRGDVGDDMAAVDTASMIHAGQFRDRIEAGSDGIPEPGRYHLYISFACPFAHRTILTRTLLGLEHAVGMSVLHPRWNTADGWAFGETPFSTPDLAGNRFAHLHQAYAASDAGYTGKVTVPVLWDRRRGRIVCNESIEIVEMLNDAFRGRGRRPDLFPQRLRQDIVTLNQRIAADLAGGVYAVAAARDQQDYDAAIERLFNCLHELDARLADGRRFLHSDRLTASDILAFTPLVRFDAVYNPLFRCSRRRLVDYCRLAAFVRRIYELPGVAATVRFNHILWHYNDGDWAVANRHGIVPAMPVADFRSAQPA